MAATSDEWAELAKRHIKATLKRHDVGYAELAKRLTEMGLPETDSLDWDENQPRGVSGMVAVRGHARHWGAHAALGIVLALLLGVSAPSCQPRPKESNLGEQHAQSNQTISGPGTTLADVVSAYDKGRADAETDRHYYEKPDSWVAIFTGLLFVSTILLWKATDENAKAALRAANVAENALKTIERAFVFIDGFDVELTTAADAKEVKPEELPPNYQSDPDLFITRFALLPRWKNSGNTPTKSMEIQVNGGPRRQAPDPNGLGETLYDYGQSSVRMILGPGAIERSDVVHVPGVQALIDWSFQPVGPEPLFLVWGTAIYWDVFDKEHHLTWCYRIRLERHRGKILRAGFIQWGEHNSAGG